MSEGWSGALGVCPTPEEIAANLSAISEPRRWDEPASGLDEIDRAIVRLDLRYEGS